METSTLRRALGSLAVCAAFALIPFHSASAVTSIATDTTLEADLFDNVVIVADDVTLDCAGFSIIGFPPFDGVSLDSRSGVTIKNCTVTGFLNGISATGASSLTVTDTTVENNALSGMDINTASTLSLSGDFTARGNGVFGVLMINNSTMTMTGANVQLYENVGGMQISLGSTLFVVAVPPAPPTSILAENNVNFGLTVVSSSHLFLFGSASVVLQDNGSNGLSVFTQSAVELDNGPSITARRNAVNGILLEDSTLNMFNMPQFPGSSLVLRRNAEAGVSVGKASVFDMGSDASMVSRRNQVGMLVDDGSTARLSDAIIRRNKRDLVLTFAARAEFDGNNIGSLFCDETVLTRGDEQCPDDDGDD